VPSGGVAGIIESGVAGYNLGQGLSTWARSFRNDYNNGKALTDVSLDDLRRISGNFQDQVNTGGLTPALNREYDVQGGRISDDATRAARSFRSSLSSQSVAGGGFLSPAAQAELSTRNEANVNENTFNARNNLAFDKARVSQAATSELQGRILQIADMVRTTGLTREQQAQMGALAINNQMLTRNKAIDDSARHWMSYITGR
jgi:hypothetical protein